MQAYFYYGFTKYRSNYCCSVTNSYRTLCDSMNCNTPCFPVLLYLLEFAQTHVHWVNDVIQAPHPLSPPSPPALNLSQHQGFFPVSQLFASGGQNIRNSASASVPPMNIQGWFPLGLIKVPFFFLLFVRSKRRISGTVYTIFEGSSFQKLNQKTF